MVSDLDAEELAAHRRWAGRARTPERTPEAEQQIADARAEPTPEELAVQIAELGVEEVPVSKATAALYDSAMVRGLVRAAQFYERDGITRGDGTLWDDDCRDALEHARHCGLAPPQPADSQRAAAPERVMLDGPRLAAYLRIEAAAKAAHAAQAQAQASLAATGAELREAFGELCKVVAS